MKSNIGSCFTISLFGESHSKAVGVVIGGLSAGILLDMDFMAKQLDKRRPVGKISTARREADKVQILSGCLAGRTTGTPLTLLIENSDTRSGDYEAMRYQPRPSHADYTAFQKYDGYQDYRGGGHFSGRLTAPIVAAGAVAMQILMERNILLGTHISRMAGVPDTGFSSDRSELERQLDALNDSDFPTLDKLAGQQMTLLAEEAARAGDSVGGVLETAILGLPGGLGEPFFDSVESKLSHLLFSIPAVKGVEFGDGFALCGMRGSSANDCFAIEEGKVVTTTNRNGGINGGITNGMPVIFRTAVKPTPSIFMPQQTVDIMHNAQTTLRLQGRHDPAIVHRARVVQDSVAAIGLLDLFCERYGTEWTKPQE